MPILLFQRQRLFRAVAGEFYMAYIANVDDQPVVRNYLTLVLTKVGHTVDEYPSLDHMKQSGKRYDLILTDNDMPGEKGIDYIRRVSGNGKSGPLNPPIVMHTSDVHKDPGIVGEARRMGADCIGKPFENEELFESINKALNGGPVSE
jgi:DNA-binding response OmpR family regulator